MPATFNYPQTPLVIGTRAAIPSVKYSFAEGLVETSHFGWLSLVELGSSPKTFCTDGADNYATFIRSAAKPFQAAPLLTTGVSGQLSSEELAIICASHTASQPHLDVITSILAKGGFTPEDLQCGADKPGDASMRQALQSQGQEPNRLHNNCSGKHAGMLFCCRKNQWDPQTYLSPDNPLQQEILRLVSHYGAVESVPLAVDGCGAPVFYLPLMAMARLYASLGTDGFFAPLRGAMISHPMLVGGEGRVDTAIMQASSGAVLAKVGADGVLCASRIGTGQGLALKIADGDAAIRNLAMVTILHRLGWLDDDAIKMPVVAGHIDNRRVNTLGQVIGEYQTLFKPGDLKPVP